MSSSRPGDGGESPFRALAPSVAPRPARQRKGRGSCRDAYKILATGLQLVEHESAVLARRRREADATLAESTAQMHASYGQMVRCLGGAVRFGLLLHRAALRGRARAQEVDRELLVVSQRAVVVGRRRAVVVVALHVQRERERDVRDRLARREVARRDGAAHAGARVVRESERLRAARHQRALARPPLV